MPAIHVYGEAKAPVDIPGVSPADVDVRVGGFGPDAPRVDSPTVTSKASESSDKGIAEASARIELDRENFRAIREAYQRHVIEAREHRKMPASFYTYIWNNCSLESEVYVRGELVEDMGVRDEGPNGAGPYRGVQRIAVRVSDVMGS